jgi:hypothetical protein
MMNKLAQKGFNWKRKEGISVVCNTRKTKIRACQTKKQNRISAFKCSGRCQRLMTEREKALPEGGPNN